MKGRSGKSRSVRTMCSGAADQRPRTKSKNARAVFLYSEPNRRAMAALPGIITSPEIRYLLAAILILTGLALAFWGHGLWATVMSLIGALLGSVVGYLFGAALGGDLTGLILAIVGAVIGSILFTKLVKVALAFLVGLLAGAVVYGLLGGRATFTAGQLDTPLIAAILVLIVVFGISYYYIDDIIGIITAAIGGLLLALGLYLLQVATITAALAGLGVFALGAFMQTAALRRKRRARAAAATAAAPPPPPSS